MASSLATNHWARAAASMTPPSFGKRSFSSISASNTSANANAIGSRSRSRPRPLHSHLLHTSPPTLKKPPRQRDLFTPSPFGRSSKINLSDQFVIHREIKEGNDPYGARSYFLLPRSAFENDVDSYGDEWNPMLRKLAIASIHANKNILFGAKLHVPSKTDREHSDGNGDDPYDSYASDYLAACGPLLDIAKEDASINGQQPQALAALNGLCSWVTGCLEKNGEGSDVVTNLMHGNQHNYLLDHYSSTPSPVCSGRENETNENASDSHKTKPNKNPRSKIQDRTTTPTGNSPTQAAKFLLRNESERILVLDAIRAIATGIPRPGHSVVGAGTYRDGKEAWMALAWEYCRLVDGVRDGGWASGEGARCPWRGLEEVLLYKSRDGEVSIIEHLAHTHPDYLRDAGGAMARLFFV
ncbi:hypothetical protein ACHAXS_005501 [Conticribra weissflogii]